MLHHHLVLAAGLAGALPVIVSTVRALFAGWTPVLDDAIIATRSFDVFSSHSPLVGEHSDASLLSVGPVFSAGPLLNWLLALPAHLPGNWALPVTMGVLNTAVIMGAVALARRRGGDGLMLMTAVALALMCRSLSQEVLHAPDNSKAVLLVFTLLLFLAWSVACGEYRLLPLTAVVASLALQAHLAVALASAGALVLATVGLARSLADRRSSAPADRGGRPTGWVLGALGAALVCWSAPLLDLAVHRPGNLDRIVQTVTTHQPTVGWTVGWHALVHTVGIAPWWLRAPVSKFSDLAYAPSGLAIVSCVAVLAGLFLAVLLGVRRRRLDVIAAAALGLVLSAAVAAYTASSPVRLVLPLAVYGLRWASPVGMFAWLALGWSVAVLLVPVRRAGLQTRRLRGAGGWSSSVARAGVAVGVTALVGILISASSEPDYFHWLYQPVRTLTSRVMTRLPRHETVLVRADSLSTFAAQEALIYQLRRSGYHPLAPIEFGLAGKFGAYYLPDQHPDAVLFLGDSNTPAPAGARRLASVPLHGAPLPGQGGEPAPTEMTVSLLPSR